MKSSKKTLAESSFILIISTALVKLISAIFKIPLASDTFLGEVGFGYFSVAHDLYMPFYTLAISGLPVAVSHIISQKISQKQNNDAYKAFITYRRLFIICGVILSLFLALLAVPVVFVTNNAKNAAYSIFAVIPSVFLCFLISVYRGYFEGFSDMRPTAVSKLIEAVCKLLLGLTFSYITLKYTSNVALAAAAAMSAVTIGTILSTVYLYSKQRSSFLLKKSHFKDINNKEKTSLKPFLRLSIPFALASLAASLVAVLDIFTVKMPIDAANSEYLSVVLAQNGEILGDISTYLYGVRSKAFTIYNLIPTFTTALGVAALPVLTAFCVNGDKKSISQNISYTLKLICTVTFPLALGMFAISDRIMSLLYSSASVLDGNLLRIYSVAGLFAGIAIPLTTVLQSIEKHRRAIINICVGLFIKIVVSLTLVLIPQINIYASPIGTFACYLYIAISVLQGIGKTVGGINYFTCIFKPLLSAAFCGLSAFLMIQISNESFVTLSAILVGVFVYLGFILITKVFTIEELKEFPIINKLFKSKK